MIRWVLGAGMSAGGWVDMVGMSIGRWIDLTGEHEYRWVQVLPDFTECKMDLSTGMCYGV